MHVCGHHFQQSERQLDMVANPALSWTEKMKLTTRPLRDGAGGDFMLLVWVEDQWSVCVCVCVCIY